MVALPGYEDAKNKPVPERYGDFILWRQLIDLAHTQKKPVVFITSENKPDWWSKHKGKTIGPRPELLSEFLSATGQQLYIYHVDRFIALAQEYLEMEETPEIVEEIFDIRSADSAPDGQHILDVDGDGKAEVVISSEGRVRIFRTKGLELLPIAVEQDGEIGWVESFFLADVDNDGTQEFICRVGYTAGSSLVCYKYQSERFILLKRRSAESDEIKHEFPDANVRDIDRDGKLEILSEPWGGIPSDLIPDEYWEKADRDDPLSNDPWGRVSYLWKWDNELNMFKLMERKLLYIGGR